MNCEHKNRITMRFPWRLICTYCDNITYLKPPEYNLDTFRTTLKPTKNSLKVFNVTCNKDGIYTYIREEQS